MKNIMSILFALAVMATSQAHATPSAELTNWLKHQIQSANQSMQEEESSGLMSTGRTASNDERMFLKNFLLRLRMQFGIAIPGFASFQVQPEAELIFQRQNPQGWENYKPHP